MLLPLLTIYYSVFLNSSNRWDAVTNLLLAEKRQKELRGQKWVKRGYEKKRDQAK